MDQYVSQLAAHIYNVKRRNKYLKYTNSSLFVEKQKAVPEEIFKTTQTLGYIRVKIKFSLLRNLSVSSITKGMKDSHFFVMVIWTLSI